MIENNIFGPKDWLELYEVSLPWIPDFLWDSEFLNSPCVFYKEKKKKETHFFFLGINAIGCKPLTIVKWHKIHTRPLHPIWNQPCFSLHNHWCLGLNPEARKFIDRTCEFRWYALLLEIPPHSTDRKYNEQVGMLPIGYEVPTGVEEMTKNILYYQKNGAYLNRNRYARVSDTTIFNLQAVIGSDGKKILLCHYWPEECRHDIGIAASLKV